MSISTRGGTARQRPRQSNDGGDYIGVNLHVLVEPSSWESHTTNEEFGVLWTQWVSKVEIGIVLVDDNVPEPFEYYHVELEAAPGLPYGILQHEILPLRSTEGIYDDDVMWQVEVHRVDGDTTAAIAEGQTVDTFEDGSQDGDLVLELIATSMYESTFAVYNQFYIDMELVGDTEAGLDATYLTDFRRRDESRGTAATQAVTMHVDRTVDYVGTHVQARGRVSIRTVDDSEHEDIENFRVRLAKRDAVDHMTFETSQFEVRIHDNDAPPVTVAADADSIQEGDDVTFTVTRSADNSTESLPVTLSIAESAEYIDYSGGFTLPTTLTLAGGESTVAVTVPTQDDRVADGDGTIVATIEPGDGYSYTAEGRTASVDVLEDMATLPTLPTLPALTLTDLTLGENRGGTVQANLSEASDETVSFSWTTADHQGDEAAVGGPSPGSGADYQSLSGTVEIAAGATSATIPVRTFPDAIDEHSETFHVVLSDIEGAMAASERATVHIDDANDPPRMSISDGTCPNTDNPADTDVSCTEGDDEHMTFEVWLHVGTAQATSGKKISVDWATRDFAASTDLGDIGKARAGSDYVADSGTLVFPPGVGRQSVQVRLIDDDFGETTERFLVNLSDFVNAVSRDPTAIGDILDDQALDAATLSVADVSVAEGAGTARVQVKLSRAGRDDVSFDYATADDAPIASAEAGRDYTSTDGTATIAAGEHSTVIDIPITHDLIYETDETFKLTLSNPVDAELGSGSSATVTILDDDRRPSLSVRDASADEESGPLRFIVERTGASAVAVSANWATADGTATSPADFTGADGTVTIAPDETTATISVTLTADDDDESDETFGVTLSSPVEGTILRGSATGTILDNDEQGGGATPRLVVTPTAVSVDEGDSAGASYTVKLASAPAGDVTVSVSGAGASGSEVAVSPSSLVFTTGNWGTAQTVTVTAGHDDDHANDAVTLANAATGGGYSGAAAVAVEVTVADDDRPALVVSPASVTVDEGDTAGADAGASYTVRLATQPSARVTVTISGTSGTEVTLDTSSFVFTADDWNTAQTVRVTAGHDDDADDDTVTLTHTAAGGGYSSVREIVTVIVADDDTARGAGLLIDPASLEMLEGGGSTYQVRLATEPTADVTVTVTGTEADLTVLSVRPTVLTFTAADWDTPRTVTLTAGADADTDDDQMTLTHTAASADTAYDAVSATLAVKVIDDGSTGHAALEVYPAQLSVDEGRATGYTVRLLTQPSADVTVTISGAAGSDLAGVPETLTFTGADWYSWQTVTMVAEDDGDIDNDEATLTHTATGGDYRGQSAIVTVEIIDDDAAGVRLAPTQVSVTEGGGGATYTAVLDSQPSANVTVTIPGASGPEVTLDTSAFTFTPDDWDTPQVVTVTAVDDDADEDLETVTLSHGTTSTDDDYDGLAPTLRVIVRDNDTAAIAAPATVTVTEGGGGIGYRVSLATEPSADVTVTIGSLPDPDITLDTTTLVFTADDWDTPQTVTVTAVDDDDDEDLETVTLPHSAASSDDKYDVAATAITTVAVRDNDDPSVQVSFERAAYTVGEGNSVDVRVLLSQDPERTVVVPIAETGQGGAGPSDYSGVPASVTFAPGETEQTFTVAAVSDTVAEDGETVLLEFGAPLPAGVSAGSPAQATVSIVDDVPPVAVSFEQAAYTVDEGGSVTVTVVLSQAPGRTVVVPITAAGRGGAGRPSDYSGVPASVTFASGDTEQTFMLAAAFDDVDDDNESVLLGFGSLPAAVSAGSPAQATVSIVDVPTVTASFEQAAYSVDEGSSVTVTVVLSQAPGRQVVVPIAAAGRGGAGPSDYSGVPASVTFASGETEQTFMLAAASDDVDDDGESVLLGFGSLPTGVSAGSPAQATVTIVDDPADVPTVTASFEQAAYSVDEGATVDVTVLLSKAPERRVVVPITAAAYGGADSSDYSGVPASVTFASGDTEQTFTVAAASDAVDDDNEWLQLGFGTLPTGVSAESPAYATVSIVDDPADVPTVTASFERATYTVDEGATVDVTVVLSQAPGRAVVVPIDAAGRGGAGSSDYSGVPASVTFASGETEQTFTLAAVSDAVDDDGESVLLGFGSLPAGVSEGSPDEATVSIVDDPADVPSVAVSFGAPAYSVDEGSSVTVTVVLSQAPGRTVVVPIDAAGRGGATAADYSVVPASVIFASGETEKTFTFRAASDAVDDDDESVLLGFGTLPTGVAEGSPDEATVSIVDDPADVPIVDDPADVPSVQVSFEQAAYSVDEGSSVTVTVELSEAPGRQVVVPITAAGRGGARSSDYSGAPTSVTFASGETEKTFTFAATADTVDDDDESVLLRFGTLPTGVAEGSPDEATVSIVDDPADVSSVQVSFERAAYSVDEGSSVTVTVELSQAPGRQVVVPITAVGRGGAGSSDYSVAPTSVTFASGDTEQTLTFAATADTVDDDDESVLLGFGALPTGVSAGSPDEATVSIVDDPADVPSVQVSFGQAAYSVDEGSSVTVTVELSQAPGRQVVVPITAVGQGSATAADYSGVPTSVTFASGDTEKTFTFAATADTVDDDNESVLLSFGSLPTGVSEGSPDEATVSIVDDSADVPSVTASFGASAYSVDEGSSVTVTVLLSQAPERRVVVPVTTTGQAGATATDYSVAPTSVTFASGDTEQTFTFAATADSVDDDNESVLLEFGTLPTGVSEGSPAQATVSIVDDSADVPSVQVSFERTAYSVDEGSSVTVTVLLSQAPERRVVVPVTTTGQAGATATDYSVAPTSVTFASGDTEQTFTFAATADTVDDDNESVLLEFGTLPTGVSEGSPAQATVTITDVPSVQVSFEQATYTVDEGTSVTVTVLLSQAPERRVVVPVTTTGQAGATAADYSVAPTSVTFASGDTEQTLTFAATADSVDDDDERVLLGFGTLPTGVAEGSPAQATVSIVDDSADVPSVTASFEQAAYSVDEGSSVTVTVLLSQAPERRVVVPVTTTGQGGATAADYSVAPTSVTFAPGDTEQTFTFAATADTVDDDNESVLLRFGTLPTGVAEGSPAQATVTITDVPSVQVSFEQATYSVDEGTSVTVTVLLSQAPERRVVVPVTTTGQAGATATDYSVAPTSVTFASGDTEQTFTFAATADSVDDDDESVLLEFGTLPTGVSEGSPAQATVSIVDDSADVPSVQVSFERTAYSVDEGSSVTVTVLLSQAPERRVVVPVTTTGQGGATAADYSVAPTSVTFAPGDTEQTFTFAATADTVDDDNESVLLRFGTLPTGVAEGSPAQATVTITDVPSVQVSFEQATYSVDEGTSVTVTVLLSQAPERRVVVPVTTTGQAGATATDYSVRADQRHLRVRRTPSRRSRSPPQPTPSTTTTRACCWSSGHCQQGCLRAAPRRPQCRSSTTPPMFRR